MRILIATGVHRARETGAAGVALQYADELLKLGHRVDTWFFDDILPAPRWPARFRDLECATALSRRIHQQAAQYDVVNLHAPWGCVYGLSRKLSSASNSRPLPPSVFTMQGLEERYSYAMRLEHRKGRATNFAWRNRLWHRLYHLRMYAYSITTADFGVVADREGWLFSEIKYQRPPGRIWYIPNGTSPQFFQLRAYSSASANNLLYVGTWLDRKGIYYLVDAFSLLASRSPDLRLTIAGCVLSDAQVKSYFPPEHRPRLTVIPFIARDAMPQLYTSHDIFVFPSLVEGMPLVLLEAMASGMPIVTTYSSGMADVIDHGRNGLLVPTADATALADAVATFQSSPELRQTLGLAAQASAKNYTWDKITLQLQHVLQLAADSSRQNR